MAKIGGINIEATATSAGVKAGLAPIKTELDNVKRAAREAGQIASAVPDTVTPELDATSAIRDLKDFDKKIGSAISSLYKLRAEAKKGVELSVSGDSLQKQIDKIIASGVPTKAAVAAHKSIIQQAATQAYGIAGAAADIYDLAPLTKSRLKRGMLPDGATPGGGISTIPALPAVPSLSGLNEYISRQAQKQSGMSSGMTLAERQGLIATRTDEDLQQRLELAAAKRAFKMAKMAADLDPSLAGGGLGGGTKVADVQKSLLQQVWGFSPGRVGIQAMQKFLGKELVPEKLMENPALMGAMTAFAVAKAVGTYGVINRNAFERDKQDGRTATAGDQWTNVVESVPVVGGLVKSLKTDLMDAFSSVNQEVEILTKAQQDWAALEERRKAVRSQTLQIEREIAANIFHAKQQFDAIGDSGGLAGRQHQRDRDFGSAKFDADQKQTETLAAINSSRSTDNQDFQKRTKELQNLVSSSRDGSIRKTAKDQLDALTKVHNATMQEYDKQEVDARKAHDSTIDAAGAVHGKLSAIAAGVIPDVDGINDAIDQLDKTIRTGAVDDIDAMRKAFEEFHPDAESLRRYNEQLEHLREQQKKLEGLRVFKQLKEDQDRFFGMTADETAIAKMVYGGVAPDAAKSAVWGQHASATIASGKDIINSTAGGVAYMNDKEALLTQLGMAGAGKDVIAKVKLSLDTKDAGEQWKAFKQAMSQLDVQFATEGAGVDERKRRYAEGVASTEAYIKDRGLDPNGSQARDQWKQLNARMKKEDDLWAARKTNQLTDDADTKEKFQRRLDEIGELLKAGKITTEVARTEIGKVTSDYDAANMPNVNPDLMTWNSGGLDKLIATEQQRYYDAQNPQLAEAQKTNELLKQIVDNQSTPQIANF